MAKVAMRWGVRALTGLVALVFAMDAVMKLADLSQVRRAASGIVAMWGDPWLREVKAPVLIPVGRPSDSTLAPPL